jgi:putative peptidoglycan lipid II flippase
MGFAIHQGHLVLDRGLRLSFAKFALAGLVLGIGLWGMAQLAPQLLASLPRLRSEAELLLLIVEGAAIYGVVILALFGRRWLLSLARG